MPNWMILRNCSVFLSLLAASCQFSATESGKSTSSETNALQVHGSANKINLYDTTFIDGDFVLFLHPDSVKFESYVQESEHVFEIDSDFGFAVSATMDSMHANEKYQNIKTGVTDNRFIMVEGCSKCPKLIDRNHVDYGIILTSKGKDIVLDSSIHSGDFMHLVNTYFGIKRN